MDRTTQKGPYWRPIGDDTILRKYGLVLHSLAHAVLTTLSDKPPSDYRFPLTPKDKESARKLIQLLLNGSQEMCIKALHTFVMPFLSARDFAEDYNYLEYSKWNDVLECFMAIYCLDDDGLFKDDVTGLFAKVEYLCRNTTLYEALGPPGRVP
jgi:hypothetical protein